MHLISERVAAGLEVNPGKIGKKDWSSKHLSSSETSRGATGSMKKTLFGGSSDARGRKAGGLKHLLYTINLRSGHRTTSQGTGLPSILSSRQCSA
jgi:hypothetical protein